MSASAESPKIVSDGSLHIDLGLLERAFAHIQSKLDEPERSLAPLQGLVECLDRLSLCPQTNFNSIPSEE